MKSYRFSLRWFFIDSFFDMRDMKTKMTPMCSPRQLCLEHLLFWPWKVYFKIWPRVRSGQGQVMILVGQYSYLPKRLDEPSHLGIFACLYLHAVASYRRKRTDCDLDDLPVTLDQQLYPDHHRWDEWSWSWMKWLVSVGLCKTGSIFKFPLRLIIHRSLNLPDLVWLGRKFRDTRFVGTALFFWLRKYLQGYKSPLTHKD